MILKLNNSGETQIDNAVITNSKINNTAIGVLYPFICFCF